MIAGIPGVEVFLDDFIAFSETEEQHYQTLCEEVRPSAGIRVPPKIGKMPFLPAGNQVPGVHSRRTGTTSRFGENSCYFFDATSNWCLCTAVIPGGGKFLRKIHPWNASASKAAGSIAEERCKVRLDCRMPTSFHRHQARSLVVSTLHQLRHLARDHHGRWCIQNWHRGGNQ